MAAPGFRSNLAQYERLLIAGLAMPGEWSCNELSRALDLKYPKAEGKDDGEPRIAGLVPSRGTITIKLDTDEEEREWEALLRVVFPIDRPPSRNGVSVDHPIFARLGIRSILVTGVSNPVHTAGSEQTVSLSWRSMSRPGGRSSTRKPAAASREEIQLRPNALTQTPAQQAQAAGGR